MFCGAKELACKGWRCYSVSAPATPVCNGSSPNWDFVTCDQQGQVTQLVANGLGLTGVLPDAIAGLQAKTIFLMQNKLSGRLPASFSSTLRMLFLGDNNFSGSIPSSFGSLSLLTVLSLFNNRLTGTIPTTLGNLVNLHQLYLGGNQLVGVVPAELCRIPNLDVLSFSNNNFSCYAPCLSKIPDQDFGATPQC